MRNKENVGSNQPMMSNGALAPPPPRELSNLTSPRDMILPFTSWFVPRAWWDYEYNYISGCPQVPRASLHEWTLESDAASAVSHFAFPPSNAYTTQLLLPKTNQNVGVIRHIQQLLVRTVDDTSYLRSSALIQGFSYCWGIDLGDKLGRFRSLKGRLMWILSFPWAWIGICDYWNLVGYRKK